MRVGLFGGTFNPIHVGHLRAVHEVQEGFVLDKIYLIPSALPPHKEPRGIADAEDRLEMCRLAVEEYPYLRKSVIVSDVELRRSGPSYTIDTVNYFKSVLPGDTEIYFIAGLDAFLEIDSWKYYQELFLATQFIVMARPGTLTSARDENHSEMLWKTLEDYLRSVVSEGYQFFSSKKCYVHAEKQPVFILEGNLLDISSTEIRKLVRKGKSILFLVPEKVRNYIRTKGFFNDE